jgi:hypothetical protein
MYAGGMGIHFFKNAAFGGDWILQERMVGLYVLENVHLFTHVCIYL